MPVTTKLSLRKGEGGDPLLGYKRSMSFYQMAIIQFTMGNYEMAAFCLHQSIEQLLIFLIRKILGIKIGTHNLERLFQFLHFYNKESTHVFERTTNSEIERFSMLKKSYIHCRYKNDMVIEKTDIQYFLSEFKKLKNIADSVPLS